MCSVVWLQHSSWHTWYWYRGFSVWYVYRQYVLDIYHVDSLAWHCHGSVAVCSSSAGHEKWKQGAHQTPDWPYLAIKDMVSVPGPAWNLITTIPCQLVGSLEMNWNELKWMERYHVCSDPALQLSHGALFIQGSKGWCWSSKGYKFLSSRAFQKHLGLNLGVRFPFGQAWWLTILGLLPFHRRFPRSESNKQQGFLTFWHA